MNWLDFEKYDSIPADMCWEEYGWGSEAKDGTNVLYRFYGDYEVFVDEVDESYGGKYACELYYRDELAGQWFDATKEDAVRGAFVESIGLDIMRDEGNCEDAVNCIARDAYVMLFGDCDLMAMDVHEVDELLKIARQFVKSHVKWVDYEWEEF